MSSPHRPQLAPSGIVTTFPSFVDILHSPASTNWPGNQPISHDPNVAIIKITGFEAGLLTNEIVVFIESLPVADIGPHSGIHAIHIVQDRSTGQTGDAWIEVSSVTAALDFVDVQAVRLRMRKSRRLGLRFVEVTFSSVSEMMAAMYPEAQCSWANGKPVVRDDADEQGFFGGFVTAQELANVRRLATEPAVTHEQAMSQCPERIYQYAMSTLARIPFDTTPAAPFFDKTWLKDLYETLSVLATQLAIQIRRDPHGRADIKVLMHFMTVLRRSPLLDRLEFGRERYIGLCRRVDEILQARTGARELRMV